jgi:hypothetical protein
MHAQLYHSTSPVFSLTFTTSTRQAKCLAMGLPPTGGAESKEILRTAVDPMVTPNTSLKRVPPCRVTW